ncbi:MAG: 3-methyladenine DNA glycosylase [Rhodothermales bacterium]|nr:3-methyladenine DNA glycosylase [Rhodothermales bacterium]
MAYTPLKYYFDERLGRLLGEKIVAVSPDFPVARFVEQVNLRVSGLELKDRVAAISGLLRECLTGSYEESVGILSKILGPENASETGMFTNGYWLMPVAHFVETYGLDHPHISLGFIEEITKRHTGEYAVRPYLTSHKEMTVARCLEWTQSRNSHVRRLASEGMRPRLPWAKKLQIFIDDPSPLVDVLDRLKDDESGYVRKSVANATNDILKDNYLVGMELLDRWSIDPTSNRKWAIKHALRNQVKRKDERALDLLASIRTP